MRTKSKVLLFLFFPLFLSCSTLDLKRKVIPPFKSYVKVHHSVSIIQCTEKFNKSCPKGKYASVGSGMLVNIIEGESIVITAGHVCESDVDKDKITLYSEAVTVIDHTGREHNTHVIKATPDDGKGSVDMCALWVPTLKEEGVDFSRFRPRPGQELYYVGSPAGIYHPPVAPILTGIYSGQIDASNSLISIPAVGGSSGSAVMDINNNVVGVLWAAHNFSNVSIMTNWDASALFLHEIIKMYGGKNKTNIPVIMK
jgi:S1-C subfamily serine protease